ncbi:MAG: aldehyde dehydrogenase family protein [Hoeflea sp.]|uniref:aldehyde dehydrogenase family protein n=1 Tax=Hoeflea sp. TaxID=1940281 RepID=UPI001D564442|nr:aldehyde dehydrogenase family protein [Hoeflea sp.]MBU4531938.1 aldehyde dehydrogenase family protein [Alphaproteobacteria bacterium]MBU4546360.1 aldehyde dehydrogenase family protein [Alphaproteobacteria bacterium]MBU4549489.1 aldehyde dehydrogenase family protein [Alphaproteobacteria bacterium]MBV1722664.1 aldehyde dehydrogenase family protein [Hoeflea sp.]MBV1782602.1 aldehyde dehydrogenase family protein [Hoeflea sp.]
MTQARRLAPETANAILVRNPFSGAEVGEVAISTASEIAAAVARAKVAQHGFRHSTPAVRRALLNNLAAEIAADAETMARLISDEMGKTIREARNEVRRAQNTLKLSGDAATFLDGEALHCGIVEGGADRMATITYEPVGVIGAVTPFNYPLNLLCHKLGPAIAAGNAVVAKPSPKAPLAAQRLRELALKAGWPADLFQIVQGGADAALSLVQSPINLLSFTGGPDAGLALKRASGLVRCLMELGGNDPLFVLPDADLDKAVATTIGHRFEIAGQSCAAVKKLYLHRDIEKTFTEKLLAAVDAVEFGNPALEETDMGTVIDLAAAQAVAARVEATIARGAKLLTGGNHDGTVFAPTVISGVDPSSPVIADETFGPIIAIRSFEDPSEAIAEVNAGSYGLQAGVFTNDHALIKMFSRDLVVGGVMINEGPDFRVEHVPFGGVKRSGLGREGVRIALREMSETKVVID